MNHFNNPFIEEKVPVDVEARLRERLRTFRNDLAGKKETRPLSRPFIRLAFGAAAIAGLILAVTLLIPGRSDGQALYAAMVEELSAGRSLAFTVVIAPGVDIEVVAKSPVRGRLKLSWGIDMILDKAKGKSLILFPKEKTYIWGEADAGGNADVLNAFESLPAEADEELGTRVIDGKSTVGFRVMKEQTRLEIWIEPSTRRLVHADIDFMDKGAVVHHMEVRNVRIAEPVDDSLFDLMPPAGYKPAAEPDGKSMNVFGPRS